MKYKYNGKKKIWIGDRQRHQGEIVELEGNEKLPWNLFELSVETTGNYEVPEKKKSKGGKKNG